MGDQRTMVVMRKGGYVTCDIAHATVSSGLRTEQCQCVGLSHARLIWCVCVDHLLVCHSSPFGECDELRISSLMDGQLNNGNVMSKMGTLGKDSHKSHRGVFT